MNRIAAGGAFQPSFRSNGQLVGTRIFSLINCGTVSERLSADAVPSIAARAVHCRFLLHRFDDRDHEQGYSSFFTHGYAWLNNRPFIATLRNTKEAM